MRPKERIPIFMKFIKVGCNLDKLIKDIYKLPFKKKKRKKVIESIKENFDLIEEYWLNNYDLRFSQVLVSLRFIDNFVGFWFYLESYEILNQLSIPEREYYLWKSILNEKMERLNTPKIQPIKDLTTEHIKSILEGGFVDSIPKHKRILQEELNLRII
jgi:hypothetical protein